MSKVAPVLITASETDPSLSPFLAANDAVEEAMALARLNAEEIEPIIKRGLRFKLRSLGPQSNRSLQRPEFEEVYNEIQLRLLKRLRALKQDPRENQIANLRGYVATVTRHTWDEYLRQKYPLRRSLRDKIRRHLLSNSEFALWEDSHHEWLAGLSGWRGRDLVLQRQVTTDLNQQLRERWEMVDVQRLRLHELLVDIFEVAQGPLDLDQLTSLIAALQGIADHPVEALDADASIDSDRQDADHRTIIEQRQLLQLIWREICQLPRRQRVALLLNLRNPQGINIITLLPATGIATFEQIAQTLEIPATDLERIWADLPLDDLRVAEYLGATRQQVINLRKTARDRLLKRMNALENKAGS